MRLGLALSLSIWSLASVAYAQGDMSALRGHPTTAPAPDPLTDWRPHYDAAMAAFHAGDLTGALASFTRAYELGGPPMLAFDMAICFDRMGQRDDAVQSYQRYLTLVPDAANRVEVEARITSLSSGPRLASRLGHAETPTIMTLVADEGTTTAPIVYASDPSHDAPAARRDVGPEWTVSWVFLGLTVATGASAGIAYAVGSSQFDSLAAYCRSVMGCTEGDIASDPSHTSATAATALWVATGVLGGITVASFVIEGLVTANPPRRTTIVGAGLSLDVTLGPGSLSLRGAF